MAHEQTVHLMEGSAKVPSMRSWSAARASSALHGTIRMSPAFWMLYDAAIAVGALYLAFEYSPKADNVRVAQSQAIAFPLLVLLAGSIAGLYERKIFHSGVVRLFTILLIAVALAMAALVLFSGVFIFEKVGRYALIYTAGGLLVAAFIPRLIGYAVAKFYKIKVLLVGSAEAAETIARRFESENSHYELIGVCNDGTQKKGSLYMGGLERIPQIARSTGVHQVVIANHFADDPRLLDRAFETLQSGCVLIDEGSFYEQAFELVLVDYINRGWFYSARLGKHTDIFATMKRFLDIVIATVCLVVTFPLFPILWFAVRLTSWGPAIYSQVRLGQFGKPFKIYKFRSMTVDAEKNGAQWADQCDPRVTPVGLFLRRTRLDELPQFWNVLKGDMSFVGPRPERPEFVEMIEEEVPFFGFRHWARPGITGLAQIRYRYGSSVTDAKEKVQHDLYYIKNWSLFLDLQIILRTFTALMRGAR